jgi:Ca2+-binding RTX toxin-like protein
MAMDQMRRRPGAGLKTGLRILGLLLPVGLATLVLPAAGAQAVHRCFGQVATMVGTSGPDSLGGTEGPDVIVGLGGNDFIRGYGGNDRICGGAGNDSADFEGGTDAPGLEGSEGNDRILGGPGFDDVNGGPVPDGQSAGHDWLYGGKGPDILCDNWCYRGFGAGEVASGPDDHLFGGRSVDVLVDTQGSDLSDGGRGGDRIGRDEAAYEEYPDLTPMTPLGRDVYLGRAGDDTISAHDGVRGNDSLDGGPHINGDRCAADRGDSIVNCEP